MLIPILQLFQERKILSKTDICNHFKIEESALEPILEHLIRQHKIERVVTECASCHSGCAGCPFANEKDMFRLGE